MSICSNLFGNLRRAGGGGDERERERNTVRIFFSYMNTLSRTEASWIIKSVFSVEHLSH